MKTSAPTAAGSSVRSTRTPGRTGQWFSVSVTVVFAAVLAVLLALGVRAATRLQSASSALQLASELSARPQLVAAQLTLIQRGLETTTYVGGSVRALATLREQTDRTFESLQAQLRAAHLTADEDVGSALTATLAAWQPLSPQLSRLVGERRGELYVDSAAGSVLSDAGKGMKASVDQLLASQSTRLASMRAHAIDLSSVLRAAVDDAGLALRALLLAGAGVALLLLALMLYFGWRSARDSRAAAAAQRQVGDILGTVREGLFLVDRQLRLSATYSQSLSELLHLPSPAGLPMQQLLEPLVDARTMTAALKFLGLLWKDKVHEELIESVNPLSQIEVSFENPRGGSELRYLAFSFRRVRAAEAAGDYILGVVADVTDRVLLARELEALRAESDSQANLQLQLLRVEAGALHAFLSSAEAAFRKSNAALNAPGIEQEDLKRKLNSVFRELHTVKGEASALALATFVQRIHAIEDALAALRARGALSGNDFLPVVVKLDELIGHLAQIRSMYERVAALRPAGRGGDGEADNHRDTTVLPGPPGGGRPPPGARPGPLPELLRQLAQEAARARSCAVRLVTRGLEEVPEHYLTVVKDICIQMLRNCIVHGIEAPAERLQLGKAETGTVQISFASDVEEYVLTVEDDGRGLSYEQIVDKALRQDLISPQQAVSLERTAVYRLIFQPGFSTADAVSEHGGRGVGLDAVSTVVRERGGRIGVSTAAGRYTRFRVLLPRAADAALSAPSAA